MAESEEVYSTQQIANSLGLGTAMIRKYALAFEKLTGEDIPIKRRDGRQFRREHFDAISRAKALVDSNNGLSVDTALRMVLSSPENAVDALADSRTSGNTSELVEAITASLTAAISKGNEPLLAELRELRQELRESRQIEMPTQLVQPMKDETRHGLLVRLAIKVESLLRR